MDANRPIDGLTHLRRAPRIALKALGRIHPVWWLNAMLCLAAGALCFGPVAQYLPMASPHIPWWTLAVAVAICERSPVHFQFGRSAHSFSLTDIPLTLGCIFASGPGSAFRLTLGSCVAMGMRKVPPIKFVFNVAQFALALCVAMISLRLVSGAHVVFGLRLWIGAYLGTQLGGIITILLLAAVMSLADGLISRHALREMFGMDLVVTAINTSLALISTVFAIAAPSALPILLVPVLIAFFGYRTYVNEHERHRKVEFLYQANRGLAESPEIAVAIEGLLERARDAFRAEEAEVVLFGAEGNPPLRTRLGPGDNRESLEEVDAAAAAALRDLAADGPVALEAPLPEAIRALADGHEVRNAMVAILRGEQRTIGTIMLSNRVGLSRGFVEDDIALFETLAANASAALQFDRLEQAVTELRDLQHRLHHQAYHDPLTGLANRALFVQRVGETLASSRGVAVMFIDLDDFKGVNDTLGHGVGDQLLSPAAPRLSRPVPDEDRVARLGG